MAGGFIEGEDLLDALEAGGAKAGAQRRVLGKGGEVDSQSGSIVRRGEQPGFAMDHHFRNTGKGGADHREAAGHSFEDDGGKDIRGALGIGEAGEGERVGLAEFLLDLLLTEDPAEADVGLELEAVDLGFEGRTLRAFADDLEDHWSVVIAEGGDGFKEDREALEIDQAADADEAEGGEG